MGKNKAELNKLKDKVSMMKIKYLPFLPAITTCVQSLLRASALAGPSWDTKIVLEDIPTTLH